MNEIELLRKINRLERLLEKRPEVNHMAALKVHRVAEFTFLAATTWTDIDFDLKIASETTADFQYYDEGGAGEDTSIIVCNTAGTYWIGGCIHPYWGGSTGVQTSAASRIVTSIDSGSTWVEKRCTQSYVLSSRTAGDYITQTYVGTIDLVSGEWLKLQGRVGNTSTTLKGHPTAFDNPTAATLGLYGVTKG